jgi:hypothetical protein
MLTKEKKTEKSVHVNIFQRKKNKNADNKIRGKEK